MHLAGGNLDPAVLFAEWSAVASGVAGVLGDAEELPGHIFNLGHGVPPDTDPDVLTRVVELVHSETPLIGDSGTPAMPPVALCDRFPQVDPADLLSSFVPPPHFSDVRFETYIPDPTAPSQAAAVHELERFAQEVNESRQTKGSCFDGQGVAGRPRRASAVSTSTVASEWARPTFWHLCGVRRRPRSYVPMERSWSTRTLSVRWVLSRRWKRCARTHWSVSMSSNSTTLATRSSCRRS